MELLPHLVVPSAELRLVRRLPTARELATRKMIALTERDREVLAPVAVHGFITVEQLGLALFPLDGRPMVVSARAYWRIRQLWLWGFLERVELPKPPGLRGSQPSLYTLGKQGLLDAQVYLANEVTPIVRRVDRLEAAYLVHDMAIAAFWVNLRRGVADDPGRLVRWLPERVLRAKKLSVRDPMTGRRLPVLPDAYFEYADEAGKARAYALEVDMGTLTLERFERKLVAHEEFLQEGGFARHFGPPSAVVLVLVHSRARMADLLAAARRVLPHRSGLVFRK